MKTKMGHCLGIILIVLLPVFAIAQTQTASAAPGGFRGDVLKQIKDAEEKLIQLAEAVPAEKYSWRPGDGVRSVSEVYMHIAGGNYLLPSFAGINPPAGISRDMEKTVTEKPKVVEALKQSFVHLHQAFEKTSDGDLDRTVKFFGQDATIRYVYMVVASHCNEHLGQSIAYARINGITPPWSASEN